MSKSPPTETFANCATAISILPPTPSPPIPWPPLFRMLPISSRPRPLASSVRLLPTVRVPPSGELCVSSKSTVKFMSPPLPTPSPAVTESEPVTSISATSETEILTSFPPIIVRSAASSESPTTISSSPPSKAEKARRLTVSSANTVVSPVRLSPTRSMLPAAPPSMLVSTVFSDISTNAPPSKTSLSVRSTRLPVVRIMLPFTTSALPAAE